MKSLAPLVLLLTALVSCKSPLPTANNANVNRVGVSNSNNGSTTAQTSNAPESTPSISPTAQPTPFQGSLLEILPQQVGNYRRSEVDKVTEVKDKLNASDALVGVYQRMDGGEELQHLIASFPSVERAEEGLRKYKEEAVRESGSNVVEEGNKTNSEGARLGNRLFITAEQREKVLLLWTNGPLLYGVISRQRSEAVEFEKNYP
jgi:hypothetical protein